MISFETNNNINNHNSNTINMIPSSPSKSTTTSNTYLNNIRKEMLSFNSLNTSGISNTSNDELITSNVYSNLNQSTVEIMQLNKNLLDNSANGINEFQSIELEDDLSPEYQRYSKRIGSLSYLTFIGAIIVLINEKSSVFIQFHAFQSFFISIGLIGFQLLFSWSSIMSIILWLFYLLFIIFMFFKVNSSIGKPIYKLPVVGNISEKRAIQRARDYSILLQHHENIIKNEIEFRKLSLRQRQQFLNNQNNQNNQQQQQQQQRSTNQSQQQLLNNNLPSHQRINSNNSIILSSDGDSMLNSSGNSSSSSIYSDNHNQDDNLNE